MSRRACRATSSRCCARRGPTLGSISAQVRARGSRCSVWPRRGRSPTDANTSCRTTSRPLPSPCSLTGSSWGRRRGRPGSAAERSSPKRSREPLFPSSGGPRDDPARARSSRPRFLRLSRGVGGRLARSGPRPQRASSCGRARASVAQGEPQALVVYPRLVPLSRLFSEGGAHAQDGRRLLLRRPTGYELHSVREYAEGESLRKVHWRSTARRGRLMVRELEDAPRDEVAILLDGDAHIGAGESFEVAVRAAGSILQAHLRRGRRRGLLLDPAPRRAQHLTSEADWAAATPAPAPA